LSATLQITVATKRGTNRREVDRLVLKIMQPEITTGRHNLDWLSTGAVQQMQPARLELLPYILRPAGVADRPE
jgi:hypothetical protein